MKMDVVGNILGKKKEETKETIKVESENLSCPGGKIRSGGTGRGLGIGQGEGPIGGMGRGLRSGRRRRWTQW